MTSLPEKKENQHEKKYRVKIGKHSLLLTIHESPTSYIFYLGGHTQYCIDAWINKKEYGSNIQFDVSRGSLISVKQNAQCSLENNLTRGHDTNQMLQFLITYIAKNQPYVKELTFNDASNRSCDNGNTISLAAMSYLSTGKTWYEKNFGAQIDSTYKKDFIEKEKKFQLFKKNTSWENMKRQISVKFPLSDEEIKELQEQSDTWQGFFGALRDKIGISEFCQFLQPWIPIFLDRFLKINFMFTPYLMPIKEWPIQQTITEQQRGGKRMTRKHSSKSC